MILKKILITECMYPKFHRFGIRRVLGSNLAEPGEPRPRPMPTPTTTPLSGWVLTCAVWAKPSALLAPCLFVGVALGREHMRSGYKLRRAALRFGLMVFSVPLRSNTEHHQTFTTNPPSSTSALSSVHPRSVDR